MPPTESEISGHVSVLSVCLWESVYLCICMPSSLCHRSMFLKVCVFVSGGIQCLIKEEERVCVYTRVRWKEIDIEGGTSEMYSSLVEVVRAAQEEGESTLQI